jgi:hypothetical protein
MIQIHACKQREKYVTECLVPELINQGFKERDIMIHMDDGSGNLAAYLEAYWDLPDHGDVWHLEDDVFPDPRFYQWAFGLSFFPKTIIAGFGAGQNYGLRDFGYCVEPGELFLSFPCIRIPCETIKDFLQWFDLNSKRSDVRDATKCGNGIDGAFKLYIIDKGIVGFNFRPCMVEHIDDMLGGSISNPKRMQLKAAIFEGTLDPVKRWLA